jgi:acetyl esterase/lipase
MSYRCLALTALLAGCLSPAVRGDDPAASEFPGARAETYKTIGDVTLKLHVFQPQRSANAARPAIVFFFGGGWRNGQPRQFEAHCRYLAERGLVSITADYRVSSRHGTTAKECVQDGKSAIRWVRTNAARLGIDPQRIVAAGGSAGGHVAACAGVIEGWEEPGEATAVSSVPSAMVLYNPAVTLAAVEGVVELEDARAADLARRMGTDVANLSPGHHVRAGLPPTIVFFGDDDSLMAGGRYFQQQMAAAGNRCELRIYPGQRHGFFNYGRGGNVYFERTLTETDRFLASLGYLEGEPHVAQWLAKQPAEDSKPR